MPSSSLNVSLGGSVTLSASAEGLADSTVSWSIVSGGGSIDAATGVYTAPEVMPVGGLAVVCATSNADPTRSGCVTIRLSPALALGGLGEPIDLPGVSEGVIVADMNGDGRPDLVRRTSLYEASSVVGGLNVMINDPEGWMSHSTVAAADLLQFAVGDLDDDGDMDVLGVGVSFDPSLASTLQVYLNDGTGRLTAQPESSPVGGRLINPALADFNGDGLTDVAVCNLTEGHVGVIYNDGTDLFDPLFKLISVLSHGAGNGLETADLNGDGRPDLVAGDNFSRKLSVVLNAGEGAWEAAKTYEVGEAPYPSVGDFTGDGWADVVMTGGDGSLYLLANTADFTGTLTPSPAIMTLPADVRNLKPVHVDTDGTLDLVALAGNSASMMLRGTEGGFEGPAWLFYGSISGAGIADFDGDGRPDIVASGLNEGKTYILPGLESGTYGFSVHPAMRCVNLGRKEQFSWRALNPQTGPPRSYEVSWNAG